jgi:hypothetical protein
MKSKILMACALLLSACASGPSDHAGPAPVQASGAAQPSRGAVAAAGGIVESLPAQTLPAGKCGLFLWTQDEPRHFILFYPAGGVSAEAILNSRQEKLTLESQGGEIFTQFMTQMTFRRTDGGPVKLSIEPGEMIDGGRRVPAARMISQDPDGWEIITPLAGLAACQPE